MAATLTPEQQRDRARLLKDQSPTARVRSNYLDRPSYYRVLGRPHSARKLSFSQMYEMQTHAIIAFAALVSLIPMFQAKWKIECASARKAQFLDNALRRIYGRLISQFSQSWFFGLQGLVKMFALTDPGWRFIDTEGGPSIEQVWDGGPNVPALIWEPFVPLRPEAIEPIYDEQSGKFDGIRFDGTGVFGFPTVPIFSSSASSNEIARKVDLDHSLWVTNQRDAQFGSVWGWPRTGYAFKPWWAWEMTMATLNRSVERKGDPTSRVRHPRGSSVDAAGEERDNQLIALEIGEKMRSGSVLAMSSELYDDLEGAGKAVPKWDADYLEVKENFAELREILGYLDVAMFRSMMVSELSVAEGSGGTSSRNVAAETGVRTAETQNGTQQEWDDYINRYMLPQLADENFPELRDVPARKVTKTFGDDEAEMAKRIFESFANANSGDLPLDWTAMAEEFGLKTLSLEAIVEDMKRREQQATQQQPPAAAPSANGAAGTVDTGFGEVLYVDARERIELEDDALLRSLPSTKHYEDKVVLANTRLIRKTWRDLLKAQYEDFVGHLEKMNLSEPIDLAADDDEERIRRVAGRIVKSWGYSAAKTAAAVKRTATALADVFDRAGRLELKRASLSDEDWNPQEKELAEWVKTNAAAMVRSVEDTTRENLRAFLYQQVKSDRNASQIAQAARERFVDYPNWRADRLARTEVRKYYNAATAFAAEAVDAQIQMIDNRPGDDPDCRKRHGKIVSPREFLRHDLEEHPYGNLAGRILKNSVRLSIQTTNGDGGDYAARVDRDTGIIYMREDLSEEDAAHFLDQVGQWLERVPIRDT